MTREENILANSLRKSGWPDMLAIRKNSNGKIEVGAYEVKSSKDSVRPNQKEMHNALRDAGLDVSVIRMGRQRG
jgi:hypothetical protein